LLCCSTDEQVQESLNLPQHYNTFAKLLNVETYNKTISFIGDSSMSQIVEGLFFMIYMKDHPLYIKNYNDFTIDSWENQIDDDCHLKNTRIKKGISIAHVQLQRGKPCKLDLFRNIKKLPVCNLKPDRQIHVYSNIFKFYRRDTYNECFRKTILHVKKRSDHTFITTGLHYNRDNKNIYSNDISNIMKEVSGNTYFMTPFPQHFSSDDATYEKRFLNTCGCVPIIKDNWRIDIFSNYSNLVDIYKKLKPYYAMHKHTSKKCMGDCTHYCFNFEFWNYILKSFDVF
jgi:hypothetical protein